MKDSPVPISALPPTIPKAPAVPETDYGLLNARLP